MRTYLFLAVIIVLSGLPTLAAEPVKNRLDIGIKPLPSDKVSWLFEKIMRKERVEPAILHAALIGPQMTLRAEAARMLAEWGDASSVPHLIHALTDESSYVGAKVPDPGMLTTRYWAAKSLRELTGKDIDFVWNDPLEKRNAAVLRWMTWYLTVAPANNK